MTSTVSMKDPSYLLRQKNPVNQPRVLNRFGNSSLVNLLFYVITSFSLESVGENCFKRLSGSYNMIIFMATTVV